ncbi:hypothetical protein C121_87 [Stenotrophomonas phage C121]|uniref:tail spike protein n=1 Tax=Stenotrophomonas phage C121 TaxID=2914029 RepID=UPI002329297F|nr:tail spike protein [Stenotrophomonas phage C121]UKL14820.1 hypothetical protein C121_87 [Stenotrophomonas phage C121]
MATISKCDKTPLTPIPNQLPNPNSIIPAWDRDRLADGNALNDQAIALLQRVAAVQESVGVTVQQFGAVGDGVVNDHAAFQKTIDYVVAMAYAQNKTEGLPPIVIPSGVYKIDGTLTTRPWIQIKTTGSVHLDFRSLLPTADAIVCHNLTTIPGGESRFASNHAPFLNGSNGTIFIEGPGKAVSTGSGLKMGNFSAGAGQFQDARITNIVISGFHIAQRWGNHNTYLCRTENCRFEQNNYAVAAIEVQNFNSGERMEWSGCTLAGAVAALMHNQVGFDSNFYGCSFDFNDDVVRFGSGSSFAAVRMEHCYYEAFSGLLVNGSALTGSDNTNQIAVMLSDAIVLARGRDSSKGVNSPSRTMFRGRFSLGIKGIKLRYETRPYLEDACLIDSDVTVVEATGYHVAPYQLYMRTSQIVNDDFDFQRNADGTSLESLTSWQAGFIATVPTRGLATVGGKKVLRIIGTSGNNNSQFTIRTKGKIPAEAGDILFSNACINAEGATGTIQVLSRVEFYDANDQLLTTQPAFAEYPFRTALNDSTVPNFSSGNARYMDTQGYRAFAPKNTSYAKHVLFIGAFDGTILISRARVWK